MFQPRRRAALFLAAALLLAGPALHAQGIKSHSAEVSGNVGAGNISGQKNFLTGTPFTNSTHITYGAAIAYNVIKPLAVIGEFNELPQGSQTYMGTTVNISYLLSGAALRFAPWQHHRYVPYLIGGAGYVRSSFGVTGNATIVNSGDYISYGAGLSYFVTPHIGVRPEFRMDRTSYSITGVTQRQNDERGTVALFYQFGIRKP